MKTFLMSAFLFMAIPVSIQAYDKSGLEDYKLDLSKPLKSVVAEAEEILYSGNISTGTSTLGYYRRLNKIENLKAYVEKVFKSHFKESAQSELPKNVKLKTKITPFPKSLNQVAWDISQANAYDTDNCSRKQVVKNLDSKKCENIWSSKYLIDQLVSKVKPNPREALVTQTTARVRDDSSGELRQVTLSTIYNPSSFEFLWFWTIEGDM